MSAIYTYGQWIDIVDRGTSGDQVMDILASWKVDAYKLLEDNHKLEAELAALREQVRWIPVKERLPRRDGFYLILENTNQVAGYYHWCKQFGWNDGGRINIQSVTHWMSLPLPPEGE